MAIIDRAPEEVSWLHMLLAQGCVVHLFPPVSGMGPPCGSYTWYLTSMMPAADAEHGPGRVWLPGAPCGGRRARRRRRPAGGRHDCQDQRAGV